MNLLSMKLGTTLTVTNDCRFVGCERGECVQQGPIYTCKQSEYINDLFHISIVLKEASTFIYNWIFESFFRIISYNIRSPYKLFITSKSI